MRVTFVGASPLAVLAAKTLLERGHEVVLIEQDHERAEALSDELDCGIVAGDGSRPSVLKEVGPEQTDFLFCVSDRDESNVLAALVGRSLGFDRVIPMIEDPDLEPICTELGLNDVIVLDREIAMQLVDLVEGRESPELMTAVRSGLRFFGLRVSEAIADQEGLDLPRGARAIARTRGDVSVLVEADTSFEEGDEVVLIVEEDVIQVLRDRAPRDPEDDESESKR